MIQNKRIHFVTLLFLGSWSRQVNSQNMILDNIETQSERPQSFRPSVVDLINQYFKLYAITIVSYEQRWDLILDSTARKHLTIPTILYTGPVIQNERRTRDNRKYIFDQVLIIIFSLIFPTSDYLMQKETTSSFYRNMEGFRFFMEPPLAHWTSILFLYAGNKKLEEYLDNDLWLGEPKLEIFVGNIQSETKSRAFGQIERKVTSNLHYVCKACVDGKLTIHKLHKNHGGLSFKTTANTATRGGLNYVWEVKTSSVDRATVVQNMKCYTLREMALQEEHDADQVLNGLVLQIYFLSSPKYRNSSEPNHVNVFPQFILRTRQYLSNLENYFLLDVQTYNFVTCHGTSEALYFGAFLSPFDLGSWLAILGFIITAPLLISILLKVKDGVAFNATYWVTAYALVSSLLGQVQSQYEKKVKLQHFKRLFRVTLGLFLLAGIVLINGYLGVVITQLTSPLPRNEPWKTFKQVVEYDSKLLAATYNMPGYKEWVQTLLKNPNETDFPKFTLWTEFAVSTLTMLQFSENETQKVVFQKVYDQVYAFPYELDRVGKELSEDNCKDRKFWVEYNNKIDDALVKIGSVAKNVPFYKGRDDFCPFYIRYETSIDGGIEMAKRLETIVATSGIYNFLKHLLFTTKAIKSGKLRSLSIRELKPQSLNSNALVVFYLFLILISISIVTFLFERCFDAIKNLNLSSTTNGFKSFIFLKFRRRKWAVEQIVIVRSVQD